MGIFRQKLWEATTMFEIPAKISYMGIFSL